MISSGSLPTPELLHDPTSDLVYRLRPATRSGTPSFLLLHGFGGDEDVLWVIESALPRGGLVASPRGLFSAEGGGYAWVDGHLGPGDSLDDFDPARQALKRWIGSLAAQNAMAPDETYVIGFSQGSALAFSVSALGDFEPGGLAALAAYLPQGDLSGLKGLPIFWSHGTQDDKVPIDRARSDVQRLRAVGADVDYCESDSGHKVGIECMRALKAWLKERAG